MIQDLLQNKDSAERADIKSTEIVKLDFSANQIRSNYQILINSISKIQGGVEIFAQVWDKNGNQIGFGSDGSVDIERFIIFNPPIMVPDGTTRVVIETLPSGKEVENVTSNYKEDAQEAIYQALESIVDVVPKFDSKNIILGKVGSTTTTVYPDANPETTSVDGRTARSSANSTWASIQSGTGTGADDTTDPITICSYTSDAATLGKWTALTRGVFLFDTSSIPDTDTISSATVSFFGTAKDDSAGPGDNVNVYSSSLASNTAVASGDHVNFGTTAFATSILVSDWSTTAYNDFTINGTGIAAIDKTGITKFGLRLGNDVTNTDPGSPGLDLDERVACNMAEQAGTTKDPKLVVTHAAGATTTYHLFGILGVGT